MPRGGDRSLNACRRIHLPVQSAAKAVRPLDNGYGGARGIGIIIIPIPRERE